MHFRIFSNASFQNKIQQLYVQSINRNLSCWIFFLGTYTESHAYKHRQTGMEHTDTYIHKNTLHMHVKEAHSHLHVQTICISTLSHVYTEVCLQTHTDKDTPRNTYTHTQALSQKIHRHSSQHKIQCTDMFKESHSAVHSWTQLDNCMLSLKQQENIGSQ